MAIGGRGESLLTLANLAMRFGVGQMGTGNRGVSLCPDGRPGPFHRALSSLALSVRGLQAASRSQAADGSISQGDAKANAIRLVIATCHASILHI